MYASCVPPPEPSSFILCVCLLFAYMHAPYCPSWMCRAPSRIPLYKWLFHLKPWLTVKLGLFLLFSFNVHPTSWHPPPPKWHILLYVQKMVWVKELSWGECLSNIWIASSFIQSLSDYVVNPWCLSFFFQLHHDHSLHQNHANHPIHHIHFIFFRTTP